MGKQNMMDGVSAKIYTRSKSHAEAHGSISSPDLAPMDRTDVYPPPAVVSSTKRISFRERTPHRWSSAWNVGVMIRIRYMADMPMGLFG